MLSFNRYLSALLISSVVGVHFFLLTGCSSTSNSDAVSEWARVTTVRPAQQYPECSPLPNVPVPSKTAESGSGLTKYTSDLLDWSSEAKVSHAKCAARAQSGR